MEAIVQTKRMNGSKVNQGVSVEDIHIDQGPPKLVFDPQHPDADARGYVAYPNIDLVSEAAKLKQASLAYDANVTVIETVKKTVLKAMTLGD